MRLTQAVAPYIEASAKTPEELLEILEKRSKDSNAVNSIRKSFQQDLIAHNNSSLHDSMQNLQHRVLESEQ